jgi:muconate cycloisomerase
MGGPCSASAVDVAINTLEWFIIDLPKRRAHNWASKMTAPIGTHLIVKIVDDAGASGWGETPAIATWGGAHMRYYGETPETAAHVIDSYRWPAIQGMEPVDGESIHRAMDDAIKGHPYAKAAVDIAIFDLAGRSLGVPVATLLGGRVRDRIPVCHSLGIMDDDAALDEAEVAVSEGIKTIKVKTGVDPERDVRLVRKLRERLGDDVALRVDANEGYRQVSQAVRVTERMIVEADIFMCEQPLPGARACAEVARRISIPVMVDESAWTTQDILEIAELGSIEVISLYVTKPGGLWRARQQSIVAESVGLIADIGGSIEMGIGSAANLQLGSAAPIAELPSVCPASAPSGTREGIAGLYYTDDLITEPLTMEDGDLLVPEGPGLGIEVDEAKIKAYAR